MNTISFADRNWKNMLDKKKLTKKVESKNISKLKKYIELRNTYEAKTRKIHSSKFLWYYRN